MTQRVHTIGESMPLRDVVELMEHHRIKRVPVLNDYKLVGIVSRANLLHALASLAQETESTPGDGEAIRECLLAELNQQSWATLGLINVIVRNGTVELWGTLLDERKRRALIVAAENVRGVKVCGTTLFTWNCRDGHRRVTGVGVRVSLGSLTDYGTAMISQGNSVRRSPEDLRPFSCTSGVSTVGGVLFLMTDRLGVGG